MEKLFIILSINFLLIFNCMNYKKEAVSIKSKENFYIITIDYTTGISPKEAGKQLGEKILQNIPNYESLVEKLLYDMVKDISAFKGDIDATTDAFNNVIEIINEIRPNINKKYYEEVEGIAGNFHYNEINNLLDGKLSRDEFYFYNLITDIGGAIFGELIGKTYPPVGCSAFAVFGEKSATSEPIIARLLDCFSYELSNLHAVTIIKNKERSVCLIGVVGSNSTLSILNENKMFSAILFSHAGEKCSYMKTLIPISYDLRYAFEEYSALNEVSDYIGNNRDRYIANSLIFISDDKNAVILENDLTMTPKSSGSRKYDSRLINEVTWDFDHSVATVNSFLLYNHEDNHTKNIMNYPRWNNFIMLFNEASEKNSDKGEKITVDEMKNISSFHKLQNPGSMISGDIYNNSTRQIIVFEPYNMNLEIFFTPYTRKLPEYPAFINVDINFTDQ